jgi:predicted secreted acid phosphatase
MDQELIDFFKKIPKNNNDIVFFDIDDTLIRPYNDNQPVTSVVNFYKYLVNNGYNTAIITARPNFEQNLQYTINDLKNIGIDNDYKFLVLKPLNENNITEYKINARKQILDMGYTSLMSIGDMHWDVGKYGGIGIIVLPNN